MLYNRAHQIYEKQQKGVVVKDLDLERPLVYYYGFSHLMRGLGLQKQGEYGQSGECISQYADLSWMTNLEERGYQIVDGFFEISMRD